MKRKTLKVTALFFAINILLDCVYPTTVWALTTGPAQPEYTSFEPVATTNMVNEFSGEFTYNLPVINVPGPNGSGYPMSLSYHSGMSPEEEASWVGYGWTLNPGAINRAKQGTPDDFNGDNVVHHNKLVPNETLSARFVTSAELFSIEPPALVPTPTIRYNNYRGFGNTLNVNGNVFGGLVSINYSVSGEEPHSFSVDLNPGALAMNVLKAVRAGLNSSKVKEGTAKDAMTKDEKASEAKREKAKKNLEVLDKKGVRQVTNIISRASNYGFGHLGKEERAFTVAGYSGNSDSYTTTLGFGIFLHITFKFGINNRHTTQEYTENTFLSRTGSLYGGVGNGATTNDYFIEKESTYNKRDRVLPIPHQAQDLFMVSGEGLSGSFHLVSPQVIRCAPQSVVSQTVLTTGGGDVTVGTNYGVGGTVGVGLQTSTMEAFSPVSSYYGNSNSGISKFFRFNNDLGGNVIYSKTPEVLVPKAPNVGSIASVFMDPTDLKDITMKPGVSSYIGYSTMEDRKVYGTSSDPYKLLRSQTRDAKTLDHVAYNTSIKDRIAELYTVNESGYTHVYGLPVFVGDEVSMSYNVHFNDYPIIENNYHVWRNVFDNKVQVGESHTNIYANTHLLTQINTPDYIDRTYNGPSEDDFGGWTKFDYRPADFYKNNYENKQARGNWYKWRMPYSGMNYNKGELSDARDDMASMQSGKKEVYYLKTIETKTHVAFFVTNKTNLSGVEALGRTLPIVGSGDERTDGCSAKDNVSAAQYASKNNAGSMHLEKLERIEIYSKDDINGKPLSTVHFDYYADGSPEVLVKGLPNSSYTNGSLKGGKLTLKRVWFEHEGVVNSKIAPYEFKYEYKDLKTTVTSPDIAAKYPEVVTFADQMILDAASNPQNPNYKPISTDGWGGNFYKGTDRINNMRPWLYQGDMPLVGDPGYVPYDPAAWQLKQIKLPTGGEILVQYEQHEYQFVQNKRALAMASLVNPNGSGSEFVINANDIGLPTSLPERHAYLATLNKYLTQEKIYFKFLYSLIDNSAVNINNCNVDYIDGFTNAYATIDPNGDIRVHLTSSGNYSMPHDACKSFVTRRRAGMKMSTACDQSPEDFEILDPISTAPQLLTRIGTDFNKVIDSNCPQMSGTHSYLRVPTYHAKRAGGGRVKRILMYDKGLEQSAEVLYGTEYFYENEDGTSSGVATNEPETMHQESALVSSIIKRNDPTWKERVMSGPERENFEGPLGESLLPSASIGYSRVITQNIHTGKTGTGFKISEYYTVKKFPFLASMTEVDNWKPDPVNISTGIVNTVVDERSVAQAYQFITNDMHGKLKRIAIFGGEYESGKSEAGYNKSFEEVHDYYKPGEKVQVMQEDGTIKADYVGREEKVSMESRHVEDLLEDMSTQFDFSIGYMPPVFLLPQYSGAGSVTYELRSLRTTVVNKLISFSCVPKSVVTTQDGITHVVENKVFSKYTGTPIVTASYDGHDKLKNLPSSSDPVHDGSYVDYKIPAYMVYPNKGQKGKNQGVEILVGNNIHNNNELQLLPGQSNKFVAGDLLRIELLGKNDQLCHVESVDKVSNKIMLVKSDRMGSGVLAGTVLSIEVLSSGYSNELNDIAAHAVTYGKKTIQTPFQSGSLSSTLAGVLTSSVSVYDDNWGRTVLDNVAEYGLVSGSNPYESGRKGKWRLHSTYALKTPVKDAIDNLATPPNKVYNSAGTYTSFTGFSFTNLASNSAWIRSNLVSLYSPDGMALEEQNALDVKSSAVYGYNRNVPVVVAKNAPYGSAKFSSFEDQTGLGIVSGVAHTGNKSRLFNASSNTAETLNLTIDNTIKQKGLLLKFWAKSTPDVVADINSYVSVALSSTSGAMSAQPRLLKVAQVGEWVLYEATLRGLKNVVSNDISVSLSYAGVESLWLDDLRIQPYESEAVCYVYDAKTLRLIASFDDQHFGLLYQYNGEGKLIRKLVETERGLKTISETQYNVPKTNY